MARCCAYKCEQEATRRYYINTLDYIYEEYCENCFEEHEPEKYAILVDLIEPNHVVET